MELFAVIMAGGVGSRFWPRSKEKTPKQLLNIVGNNTMIQDTVSRLNGLVEKQNIFIITNKVQKDSVIEQLPQIPKENVIAEPYGKNTAACIGLASIIIKSKSKDAVTIILPADHLINDDEIFKNCLKNAANYAYKSEALVTIGIKPNRPETGYGYIQFKEKAIENNIFEVVAFAEKPDLKTAVEFVKSGDFLWNAGIFIWRVDTILEEIKKYLPDLREGLNQLEKNLDSKDFLAILEQEYGKLKSISVDYGIMEKSEKVFVTCADFYWNDLGNWEAVYEISEKNKDGNALIGDVYSEKTNNSYLFSQEKFTAVIGLDNVIVINTKDALLICNRNNTQDVRNVVDYLKMENRKELI